MWNPFRKKREAQALEVERIVEQRVGAATQRIKNQLGIGSSGYGNAGYYSGRSGGEKYPYGLSASGSARIFNHRVLRRNARDAYHDTPQAKALVDRYADTVADTGLRPECAPIATILGITPEAAEDWARDVEIRFDLYAKDKKAHRAELMTFYQYQRKYQIFQHRDNDIFTRLYYNGESRLQNPLQFEAVDPDQIRGDAFTSTYGFQSYEDGIKRDDRGREVAYKIWVQKKGSPNEYDFVDIPRIGRSGRIFMLHGFDAMYAGQGRGFSRLAYALQEFENITDLSLAHIKKAINESSISMYVRPSQDNPASNPFEDMLRNAGAGPAGTALTEAPTNAEIDATGFPVNYHPLPEATVGAPGSVGVFNLTEGEDLKAFETKTPSDSYAAFIEAFTSHLSSASGMPIEVLLMKFGTNYSASRASLILFWRICQIWREEMASDLLNPVFKMWLSGEIAAGRVTAPGFSDPVLQAAWLNCSWIGSPMPNIDPMRTAAADEKYVQMGAQTLDMVSRNLNGSDGAMNRRKLSRELDEMPPGLFAGQASAAPVGDQEEEEDE